MAIGIETAIAGYAWEKLKDPIVEGTKSGLRNAWKNFEIATAQKKYQAALLAIVRSTRLLGHPAEVDVDQTYAQVYVYDRLTAFERFDVESLADKSPREDPVAKARKATRAVDVVKRKKRLFILGKPGAGKTTFLKYLAILCCKGLLPYTPFFIPLKHWADSGLTLFEYCCRQLEICEFPDAATFMQTILRSGKAMVLLDGLDEVNQEGKSRTRMIEQLVVFANNYADSEICLTCRVASNDYSFEHFTYVEIADFNDEQKKELISKWYASDQARRELFFAEWDKAEHVGIRELGQTPLLLALMCLVFDETLRFPLRRVELYKEAVEALLRRWDSSRNITRDQQYLALSLTRKEQFLSELAYENFTTGRYYVSEVTLAAQLKEILQRFPRSDMEGTIDAIGVIKAVESNHGLIVERAHKIYSFSHLTVQEYFTAKYIVECVDAKVLSSLAGLCLRDKRWREVSLMTASLMPNADRFVIDLFKVLEQSVTSDLDARNFISMATAFKQSHDTHKSVRGAAKRAGTATDAPVLDEILDAALDLIVQLEFSKTADDCLAVRRGRNMAHFLGQMGTSAQEMLRSSGSCARILLYYLRGCGIVVEILNLAVVRQRDVFENRILNIVSH